MVGEFGKLITTPASLDPEIDHIPVSPGFAGALPFTPIAPVSFGKEAKSELAVAIEIG